MSPPDDGAPIDRPEGPVVRGLADDEADLAASSVLARVAWNGPVLDPDQLSAAEFLSALP